MPKSIKNLRTRHWTFTNFDELEFDYNSIMEHFKYIAYGLETCPKTGRQHHQGFCVFKHVTASIKGVKKKFRMPKLHVEKMHHSIEENEDYCSKETAGTLVEFGKRNHQGCRTDNVSMMDGVKEGLTEVELAEANPALWCQYGRRWERYRELLEPARDWVTEVFVFWGPPDTGKTREAWARGGPGMDSVSIRNGFVIGYTHAPDVLMNEFEPDDIPRKDLLDMWDRYKHTVNVKNQSNVMWNPRRIFVTTNTNPWEWGVPGMDRDRIRRRITEIEYFGNFGEIETAQKCP